MNQLAYLALIWQPKTSFLILEPEKGKGSRGGGFAENEVKNRFFTQIVRFRQGMQYFIYAHLLNIYYKHEDLLRFRTIFKFYC